MILYAFCVSIFDVWEYRKKTRMKSFHAWTERCMLIFRFFYEFMFKCSNAHCNIVGHFHFLSNACKLLIDKNCNNDFFFFSLKLVYMLMLMVTRSVPISTNMVYFHWEERPTHVFVIPSFAVSIYQVRRRDHSVAPVWLSPQFFLSKIPSV